MTQLISKSKRYRRRGDIYFVICNSCFWCASYISTNPDDTNNNTQAKCPDCLKGSIESIPVAKNEGYVFE
jgi:hypothetical protein